MDNEECSVCELVSVIDISCTRDYLCHVHHAALELLEQMLGCSGQFEDLWLCSATRLISSVERTGLLMDWSFLHKVWDKWAPSHVGSSGQPLKAALLLNYDPTGPSRLLSVIAKQEGIKADPIDLSQFIDFIKWEKFQKETFMIGANQYMVTSIHENWFGARCINTSRPAGEGAIVMQTTAFILVALYDGSIGAASRAMVAADQLAWQLSRKNL